MQNIKPSKIKVNCRTITPKTDIVGQIINGLHIDDYDHPEEAFDKDHKLYHKHFFKVTCIHCKREFVIEREKIRYKNPCGCQKPNKSNLEKNPIYKPIDMEDGGIKIIKNNGEEKIMNIFVDPRDIIKNKEKFGKLTPIELVGVKELREGYEYTYVYKCICECGNIVTRDKIYLQKNRNNPNLSCGKCINGKNKNIMTDIIGKKFGLLKVIDFDHYEDGTSEDDIKNNRKKYFYKCRCSCPEHNEIIVERWLLKHKNVTSCGCKYYRHDDEIGYEGFRESFKAMHRRCNYNPDKPNDLNTKYHGAKGVKVCKEWLHNYKQFKKDMFEEYKIHVDKFGRNNTSLDRRDPYGDYCKENCRWATYEEQNNNKRDNNYFYYRNKKYTISQMLFLFADSSLTYNRLRYLLVDRPNPKFVKDNIIINSEVFRDNDLRELKTKCCPIKEIPYWEAKKYELIELPKSFNYHNK